MRINVVRWTGLPVDEMGPLLTESRAEGFPFVDRLVDDYVTGINRFDEPGEALFGAYAQGQLVGVGGLNLDPYLRQDRVGRVRHLYVAAAWRRHGIGTQLMAAIIAAAGEPFDLLTLRTFTATADRFYRGLNFQTEPKIAGATHHLQLTGPPAQ